MDDHQFDSTKFIFIPGITFIFLLCCALFKSNRELITALPQTVEMESVSVDLPQYSLEDPLKLPEPALTHSHPPPIY